MSYRLPTPTSLSQEERMQYRASLLPERYKGCEPEILQDGSAMYTADEGERFYLRAFAGKALRVCRDVSGYYPDAASREQTIERFKQGRERHHAARVLRRQAARKPHTLKVGDVLNTSWGYVFMKWWPSAASW